MANSDHINLIKDSVENWNNWRKESPEQPDFGWANLNGLELDNVLLNSSNLKLAFCKDCSFRGADFSDSNLYGANFQNSDLSGSNLEKSNLEGAHLVNANLKGANLKKTNLKLANLDGSILENANLSGVRKLKVSQLLNVKSLKNCKMDGEFLEKIRENAPHLLD